MRLERLRAQRERAERLSVWDLCKRAECRIELETLESHSESAALFERAIEIDSNSARAWAGLALAHSSSLYLGFSNDLQATSALALGAAQRAVDLAPEDAEAQLSLGRALALSRKDEAAVPHLEASLEGNPSSSVAHNTLAGALRRQGLSEEAIPHYEICVRLSPESPAVYHALGGLSLSHFAAERYERALDYAEQAVRYDRAAGPYKSLDFSLLIPASLALLDRVDRRSARSLRSDPHAAPPRAPAAQRALHGQRRRAAHGGPPPSRLER
jgi:tetratricopeptide (TPR) repeat protein